MVFHCVLLIIYLIKYPPFELNMLNKLEIFNELCILSAALHLFMFTDFTPDPEFQLEVGWSIIGVTTLNIIVNMIVMIRATAFKIKIGLLRLRAKLRMWRAQKKAKKY
jgi:hypothetical protein